MRTLLCLAFSLTSFSLFAFEPACPTPWGYEESDGPDRWGQMDEKWAKCDSGWAQSPIKISTATNRSMAITINYAAAFPVTVQNTGHEIKVWPLAENRVYWDGRNWTLIQFHFHVPAEHPVAGINSVAEMHMVHEDANGNALAVAVLFQPQTGDNPGLTPLLGIAPKTACTSAKAFSYGQFSSLLPANRGAFYMYGGSLTTPPCTEPVTFIVMRNPVGISEDQLKKLRIAHGDNGNVRPAQPQGTRTVYKTGF
jgi:carbonic anhydrase